MKDSAQVLVELFKRGNYDLLVTFEGKKHEKQLQCLQYLTDKETTSVCFGGAAGGAKSYTGCTWLVFMALSYPGTKYFIGREELKRLRDSTLLTFFKVCKNLGIERDEDWKYNGQDHFIDFTNGSRIDLLDLKYLPSDPFYERYGSTEYTCGFIEEAGEVDFDSYDTLKSRVGRHLNDKFGIKSKILCTLNPSKNWVYNVFWKPFRDGNEKPGVHFIRSFVQDNPFIETQYIENLENITDKVKKQRLLFGNFDFDDDDNSLMTFNKISDCFTNTFVPDDGQMFISADLALTNDDFVLIVWKGLRIKDVIILNNMGKTSTGADGVVRIDFGPLVNAFNQISTRWQVPRSNIVYDADGLGHHMKNLLAGAVGLNTGMGSLEPGYKNLRCNLYYRLADLVNSDKIYFDCSLASNVKERVIDELQAVKRDTEPGDKLGLLPKSEVKKIIGHSPDVADALAYRILFNITRKT